MCFLVGFTVCSATTCYSNSLTVASKRECNSCHTLGSHWETRDWYEFTHVGCPCIYKECIVLSTAINGRGGVSTLTSMYKSPKQLGSASVDVVEPQLAAQEPFVVPVGLIWEEEVNAGLSLVPCNGSFWTASYPNTFICYGSSPHPVDVGRMPGVSDGTTVDATSASATAATVSGVKPTITSVTFLEPAQRMSGVTSETLTNSFQKSTPPTPETPDCRHFRPVSSAKTSRDKKRKQNRHTSQKWL